MEEDTYYNSGSEDISHLDLNRENVVMWNGTTPQLQEILDDKKREESVNQLRIILTEKNASVDNITITYKKTIALLSNYGKSVPNVTFNNVVFKDTRIIFVGPGINFENIEVNNSSLQSRHSVLRFYGDTKLINGSVYPTLSEVSLSNIRTFTIDDLSSISIDNCLLFVDYDQDVIKQDYIFYHKTDGRLRERTNNFSLLNITSTTISGNLSREKTKTVEFTNVPSRYYTKSPVVFLPRKKSNYGFGVIIIIVIIILFLLLAYAMNLSR